MSKFYRAPIALLRTFEYPPMSGDQTIEHIGDLDGMRYFHIPVPVALPHSQASAFSEVELTIDLAEQLRAAAPACAKSLIVTKAETKAATKAAINAEREARLVSTVTHNGKTYHTDQTFLVELLGMVLGYSAGVLTGKQNIRTIDNKIEQLDQGEVAALAAVVGDHRKGVYAWSWKEKDALDA